MFCDPSGYRGDLSGTSMASPHLAGVVALVLAHGIANAGDPSTVADDVKAHLCTDASVGFGVLSTPIPTSDPRYAQYFGCGVVNAARALITDPPPDPGNPTNHPPTAANDAASTPQNTAVDINVLANDTDLDGDALTLTGVGTAAHGAAAVNGSAVHYAPASGYSGSDSFTYSISDGHGGTSDATVSVTVTAPTKSMHVGDLDAFPTRQASTWSAKVRVYVHNANHAPLAHVKVKAQWNNGKTQTCTTGALGYCELTVVGIPLRVKVRTLTITNLTSSGRVYVVTANHDPDADSNGTAITQHQP